LNATDIVIVPSILLTGDRWENGRYPELVAWLRAMHDGGAILCSACSGLFLLAETGLFDEVEATVHWGYAAAFKEGFPNVPVHPDRVLVISGARQQFVSSGASMTWHDLVLYLIVRYVGATAAQSVARFFALQWHHDGLAPYIVFEGPKNHGDSVIVSAQEWLAANFSIGSPVDEVIRQSGLAERTFKRRFTKATGFAPIEYIQRLRIEDAKKRLERTDAPARSDGALDMRIPRSSEGCLSERPAFLQHSTAAGFKSRSTPSETNAAESAFVKGFGCRPLTDVPRAWAAGVGKPPGRKPREGREGGSSRAMGI
jgi:transcriptional regulator GlxA family with amidase domain